jgi:hypothetical protein
MVPLFGRRKREIGSERKFIGVPANILRELLLVFIYHGAELNGVFVHWTYWSSLRVV